MCEVALGGQKRAKGAQMRGKKATSLRARRRAGGVPPLRAVPGRAAVRWEDMPGQKCAGAKLCRVTGGEVEPH